MARAARFGWMAVAVLAAGLFMVAPTASLASGGGGGGGMSPSSSGPSGPDPAKAYQDGVAAFNAHDYATAARKFRIAVDAVPNNPEINFAYAMALVGNGDYRGARRPLERIVRADNPSPEARKQLGLVYLKVNEPAKASEQLAALDASLTACDAACGDQKRTQIQAARDALKQAIDAPPAATAPTTGWLLPGTKEGRAAYAEGVGLVNRGRYADALDAFMRTETAMGPHPDVLNYIGFTNRKLGHYVTAETYYRAALAIDPNHRGATEYLGELYLEIGRVAEARQQLARLESLCPYGCAEHEELARWVASGR